MRLIVAGLLVLLLMPLVRAAPPPADDAALEARMLAEVKRRLAAKDARTRAWGAHLVARYRLGAVDDLVEILREQARLPVAQRDEWLCAAALDGLVRVEADLPSDLLLAHARGALLSPVLALIADDWVGENAARLPLFERLDEAGPDDAWVAAGSLCRDARERRFAAAVLRRFAPTIDVHVRDSRPRRPSCGGPAPRPAEVPPPPMAVVPLPEKWPPIGRYVLHRDRAPVGSRLLVEGPPPLLVRRVLPEGGRYRFPVSPPVDRQAIRGRWLFLLAHPWEPHVPRLGGRSITVRWKGNQPTLRVARRAADELEDDLGRVIRKLLKEGFLRDVDLASTPVRIRVRFHDERARRGVPLPPDESRLLWGRDRASRVKSRID
jgi:hypothetical protein